MLIFVHTAVAYMCRESPFPLPSPCCPRSIWQHWVIARMERRQSFSSPDEYYIYERQEFYQVEDGTDADTIRPWEVTWGNRFGTPDSDASFTVTQGCSYCPPPWPTPRKF